MEKFIQGYPGCAKTSKMLEAAEELLKDKYLKTSDVAFVTFTRLQKEELSERKNTISSLRDVCVYDMCEFCKSFLPENFRGVQETFINRHIISNISEDVFSEDYSLRALLKTESFSKELYELFCLFRKNEISCSRLADILSTISLSDSDFRRLKLVFEVYGRYCKTLENLGYSDYYALISSAASRAFKKYKYLFVDDVEELSPVLRKFFVRVSEDVIFVEDIAFSKKREKNLFFYQAEPKRNQSVFQRAEALRKEFLKISSDSYDFCKNDSLRYLEFSSFEEETAYVAADIKKHLSESMNFSDFAIVPVDKQKKRQLVDFLCASNIPLNIAAYCEKFENFRAKIIRYLNICVISKKLCFDEISKDVFSKTKLKSRVDEQIYLEEFDLYFENILSDIFDDIYKKDRFVFLHSSSKNRSLLLSVYKNLDILSEDDKSVFLKEMNTMKIVYSKFLESDFVGISDILQHEFADDESRELLKKFRDKLYTLSVLYDKIGLRLSGEVVLRFLDSDFLNISDNKNCVSILSFNEVIQREFKYIYIPFLSDESFPRYSHAAYFISQDGNNKISEALRAVFPDFSELIASDKFIFYEDLKNLYYAIAKAKKGVVLSYHSCEGSRSLAPSIFFEFLKNNDSENFSLESVDLIHSDNSSSETRDKGDCRVVFEEGDLLKLNASSISSFLSCERKFFFKNVLNLKEKGSFQASYGTVVHAILEVFNKTCLKNYTKDKLISISDILFSAKYDAETALEAGYSRLVVSLIESTDDLSLSEMKKKFLSAVDDMERGGFFNDVPDSAFCEQSFEFELPGVERVFINGKIDAVLSKDGEYSLVDYKTGAQKQPLSYYFSDYGVNFESDSSRNRGTFSENNVKNYQYQMPLYYLALQNADSLKEFKNRVKSLGFKYIRPLIKGEKSGYYEDFVSADVIEEKKDKIIENITKTVVDKIRGCSSFPKTTDKRICSSCSYAFLCGEEALSDAE